MPLGKYYCDYCDKEFQDTPHARKRHLQSSYHLRSKSLWYNSLNSTDSVQPYPDGFSKGKGVCNRFVQKGFCPFGDSCKYLHPKTTIDNNLQSNPNFTVGFLGGDQKPSLPGYQLVGGSSLPGTLVRDGMGMSWNNLPPSLRPPPEGGYPPHPFVDWG